MTLQNPPDVLDIEVPREGSTSPFAVAVGIKDERYLNGAGYRVSASGQDGYVWGKLVELEPEGDYEDLPEEEPLAEVRRAGGVQGP